jgi:2'-5' RNA ligase
MAKHIMIRDDTERPLRAFIAVDLDDACRAALSRALDKLVSAPGHRAGRWVAPSRMHLTLAFFGALAPRDVALVEAALGRACSAEPCFSFTLDAPGFFPDASRPRVAWVGVGGDAGALARLHRALQAELSRAGLPTEDRELQPHLTLARLKDRVRSSERRAFVDLVSKVRVEARVSVREVVLFRSDPGADGPIYTRVAAAPLR